MAEPPPTQWRLQTGQYLGEISALCFLHLPSHVSPLPYLLAGSSSQILLYDLDSGKLIRSFHVFQGIRVHGIACNEPIHCAEGTVSSRLAFQLAVFAERRVKLFSLVIEFALGPQSGSGVYVNLDLLHLLPRFSNWVLDVFFLKKGSAYIDINGATDGGIAFWDLTGAVEAFMRRLSTLHLENFIDCQKRPCTHG